MSIAELILTVRLLRRLPAGLDRCAIQVLSYELLMHRVIKGENLTSSMI